MSFDYPAHTIPGIHDGGEALRVAAMHSGHDLNRLRKGL